MLQHSCGLMRRPVLSWQKMPQNQSCCSIRILQRSIPNIGTESRVQMRIAQVAPLVESVPPKHYGGTERIISYLTEELVRCGHDVTLFGSGDSVTGARLIAPIRRSIRKN